MSETKSNGVIPFSNGSQFADWQGSNCDRCKLQGRCEIDAALIIAYCSDGTVTPEIAKRMGYDNELPPRYGWKCTEVEWTEEWKAEVLSRKEQS